MTEPILSARRLRCHFRRGDNYLAAVDGVDLDIYPGEVVGLVGESGSGKSTLGRMVTGLQSRSDGSLYLAGRPRRRRADRAEYRRLASEVQMVFQDSYSCLNPRLKVIDSLIEPLRTLGVGAAEARRAGQEWLDRVGLPAAAGQRYPHELSGGQRQRVGIGRAFSVEPALVVCDEAVSALDVSIQAQVLGLLKGIQREKNTAMLFISHDLAVIRHLADRVAVMYQGEIVEIGSSDQVYESPQHPYTRALLALHMDAAPQKERAAPRVLVENVSLKTAIPLASDRGCRYALRCPWATAECGQYPPSLREAPNGAEVACHRLSQISG
jgi:oligopeptide/dipeptide ABC transporter ATP-binding protein